MMPLRFLVVPLLLALHPQSFAQSSAATPGALRTVESVDINRYMGRWFEVALIPNKFQSMCVANTSANYALLPNGRISVTNTCRTAGGGVSQADGQARLAEPGSTTKLEVRFAPAWLSWLSSVWGNYWVIGLDEQYRWALVGEPKREFLWLLSRTPVLDEPSRQKAIAIAAAQGYDISRVQPSKQGPE